MHAKSISRIKRKQNCTSVLGTVRDDDRCTPVEWWTYSDGKSSMGSSPEFCLTAKVHRGSSVVEDSAMREFRRILKSLRVTISKFQGATRRERRLVLEVTRSHAHDHCEANRLQRKWNVGKRAFVTRNW